jgi:hypothetical protein
MEGILAMTQPAYWLSLPFTIGDALDLFREASSRQMSADDYHVLIRIVIALAKQQ